MVKRGAGKALSFEDAIATHFDDLLAAGRQARRRCTTVDGGCVRVLGRVTALALD